MIAALTFPGTAMIEAGKFLQQRYRIDKQIGQGGMGAVYVATDERFGSRVAIKETLFMDDNFRKAIEREARLLNSLKHSALPRVTDHFEEDNGQFLVMEYIAGEDVATILEREKRPFPVETVKKWADQLLDALDYLHNQAIPVVHRDIKPQNLKITPKGDVILLDFGLAKGNPTDAAGQTNSKSIFGYSKNYASLEQIQGTGTDPRSDLYSLAATLYHLLTNVAPEDALTRAMSVLAQKGDPLLPASMLEPTVPKGIAGVLYSAMDLNASGRPSSASEMRNMLRNADEFAYLTENVGFAAATSPGNVFAQKTRIMPEGTNAMRAQELNTEVLPSYDSQETHVKSVAALAATTESPRRDRRVGFLAGAAAVVLLACLGATGVYFLKPEMFGGASATTPEAPAQQPLPSAPQPAAPDTAASAVAANSSSNSAQSAASPAEPAQTKSGETAKTNTKKTGKGNAAGTDETVVEVPDVDNDLPDGGMVVTKKNPDGTTSTTRIVPRAPRTPGDHYNPLPPGFDPGQFQYMSPEERQRMQEIIRKNVRRQQQEQMNRRRPAPSPTPDQ